MSPERLFDILRIWIECLIHPLAYIEEMLHRYEEQKSLALLKDVWFPSIFLSIIVNYPILRLFGVEWTNIPFYVIEQTILLVSLFVNVLIVHLFMRMSGMLSRWGETIVLYTIVVIYTPISAIISLPASYKWYDHMRSLKFEKKADLASAFQTLLTHEFVVGDNSLSLENAILYSTSFIFLLTLAAFAECMVQWYGNHRYRTYLAIGTTGLIISSLHRWVEFPLRSLDAYFFMK